MPRVTKPLTNTEVDKAKTKDKEYNLSDGNGLFLRIKPTGAKAWIFNYYHPVTNKRTSFTIGTYPAITLAQARQKREEYCCPTRSKYRSARIHQRTRTN